MELLDSPAELERLATLHSYAVLDSPAEDTFDDLTKLASMICGAPIALVSLVDSNRIWFKSKIGLDVSEIPRIDGFCSSAILSSSLLIVPDATADERLASHPLVTSGPKLRFYAGAPLIAPGGHRIGSLCVIDTVPRHIDGEQAEALECIARTVMSQIELRVSLSEAAMAERSQRKIQTKIETQIAERTKELAMANSSLQRLTHQLLKAQEDERRRIARELHDETGQVLAALSMTLDGLQTHSAGAYRRRLADCKTLLKQAVEEIRSLAYVLHPPLMDELGLGSAVAEYVRGFEERSGIKVRVAVAADLGRMDMDREIALFRIIQESFGNIHRHSGSRTASVSLMVLADTVVLEVRDEGKGFRWNSHDPSDCGLGIRSMEERLRFLGGSLQLRSSEFGTTVRAEMPMA
jgi:signal transduction histidine kinase